MSTILEIDFSNWAEQETRRRGGFNEFSEYIKRGPQENYPKNVLGKNCKYILDSHFGNYT